MKKLIITVILLSLFAVCAVAQSSEFTYQGRLLDNTLPPTANYDFEFSLWDSLVAGTQQGTTQTVTGVAVANGIFTVRLNFGAQFNGTARFLQIAVRPAGGPTYTTLAPRQPFTSAPYAIKSNSASSADSANSLSAACTSCVFDSHINTVSGFKVTGQVFSAQQADFATFAQNVSGVVAIANGGTGSSTKNFVDLSTDQTIGGNKSFLNLSVGGTFSANLQQYTATVYSTGSLSVTPSTPCTLIPGLTQTFTVPTNQTVFVNAAGGVQTSSSSPTGFSLVDIKLLVDGVQVSNGGLRRVLVLSNGGILGALVYWDMTSVLPLSLTTHTISVQACGLGVGANATVAGNNTSVLESSLTVITIKN